MIGKEDETQEQHLRFQKDKKNADKERESEPRLHHPDIEKVEKGDAQENHVSPIDSCQKRGCVQGHRPHQDGNETRDPFCAISVECGDEGAGDQQKEKDKESYRAGWVPIHEMRKGLQNEGHKGRQGVRVGLSNTGFRGPWVGRVDKAQYRIEVAKTVVTNALKGRVAPDIVGLSTQSLGQFVTEVTRGENMQKSRDCIEQYVETEKYLRPCMNFR